MTSHNGFSTAIQDILEQLGFESLALELEQQRVVAAQEQFRQITGTEVTVAPGTLVLPIGFVGAPGPGQVRAEDVLARPSILARPFVFIRDLFARVRGAFLRNFGLALLVAVLAVGVGVFVLARLAGIKTFPQAARFIRGV